LAARVGVGIERCRNAVPQTRHVRTVFCSRGGGKDARPGGSSVGVNVSRFGKLDPACRELNRAGRKGNNATV
jgi:hypothetical protein